MSRTATVTVTHRFSTSPEQVFDAWLDPAPARHFLFATATGTMLEARIDARAGGELTLTHDGVLEAYLPQTRHGWETILSALERTLR